MQKTRQKLAQSRANKILMAIGRAMAQAAAYVVGLIGWPVLAGCLIVFLIVLMIFGSMFFIASNGYFGKSFNHPAGANDPNIKIIMDSAKADSGAGGLFSKGPTIHKVEFLHDEDRKFVEEGKIDKRLAATLAYLIQKHEYIKISHIVSGYNGVQIDTESGALHDPQITQNISAHKEGLAADISEIDQVKKKCSRGGKIPIQVSWQTIGEKANASPPDVLKEIKSPADLANDNVRKALEKLGVKGLDQKDINEKLSTISGISSVTDLTDPAVIKELEKIGISGLDNPNFQAGLKKLAALQKIYEINPRDIDALTNPDGPAADLLKQMGITIDDETAASIRQYQKAQVLANIERVEDLDHPAVREALKALDVDPDDPMLRESLGKMTAAQTVINWRGDFNDPSIIAALTTLGVPNTPATKKALEIQQAARNVLNSPPGTILADIDTFGTLEKLGIKIDNSQKQEIYNIYQTSNQLSQWQSGLQDNQYQALLTTIGISYTPELSPLLEQYQAAQYVVNSRGDLNDPYLRASLKKLKVSDKALENMDYVNQVRQEGPIAVIKIIQEQIPSSPDSPNQAGQHQEDFNKLKNAQTLLSVRKMEDLNKPEVKKALSDFGVNYPKELDSIVKLAQLKELTNVNNAQDLQNLIANNGIININLPPQTQDSLAKMSSVYALTQIRNPLDLTRPEVQGALNDLGINTGQLGDSLGYAANINALLSIRRPEDLFNPDVIQSLDRLGIIKVNDQLLGQIGSVQTLLQIDSIDDVFNVDSILALSNLGLISLGPVAPYLAAVTMIANILGIDLSNVPIIGSLFGGNTKCYKQKSQEKIHQVVDELLQFPYDAGDKNYYRPTQLIVYSQDRDVTPFADKINTLYGKVRPANYGLFAMPEAWDHIHIAY